MVYLYLSRFVLRLLEFFNESYIWLIEILILMIYLSVMFYKCCCLIYYVSFYYVFFSRYFLLYLIISINVFLFGVCMMMVMLSLVS